VVADVVVVVAVIMFFVVVPTKLEKTESLLTRQKSANHRHNSSGCGADVS
jgi:hypothetical protein